MIDEIFEMMLKEARSRKGKDFEISLMMVLCELSDKVCGTIKSLKVEDKRPARFKYIGDNP